MRNRSGRPKRIRFHVQADFFHTPCSRYHQQQTAWKEQGRPPASINERSCCIFTLPALGWALSCCPSSRPPSTFLLCFRMPVSSNRRSEDLLQQMVIGSLVGRQQGGEGKGGEGRGGGEEG
eukprot:765335-Hanusia_phi.AAC.2